MRGAVCQGVCSVNGSEERISKKKERERQSKNKKGNSKKKKIPYLKVLFLVIGVK